MARWPALAAAIAAGCSGTSGPPNPVDVEDPAALDATVPVDGDALVVAVGFDPGNLNPVVAPYQLSTILGDLVQPGLVRRHVEGGSLVYEPVLAESFAFNDAGDQLTYTLREGLVWEDGTPLTSADVAFTHELIRDPAVASNWLGDSKHIAAIDTPDAQTVRFTFGQAQNPILAQGYTIRGIVPQHVLADADRSSLRGHPSSKDPLASGSYTVTEWAGDDKIVLEPNPRAPEHLRPHVSRIVVRILPEYSTRIVELERGTVDLVSGVEVDDAPRIRALDHVELRQQPSASMQYVGYDLTDPRFADGRVRTALTMAIHRERLIRDLLTAEGRAYGRYCVGTISPAQEGWFATDLLPIPFDAGKAIELLEQAGYEDADGDGVREKGDQQLRFDLMIQTGSADLKRIAVLVQAYWEAIGVKAEIALVDPVRFSELAREHDFEALLWSFGANPKVDPSIQWSTGGQYNWTRYSNPKVDDLIAKGLATTDVSEAQEAFKQVQRLVHADQPVTFLFWADELIAVDKRFEGVQMNTFTFLHRIEEWYVPVAEQKYRGIAPPVHPRSGGGVDEGAETPPR